MMHLASVLILMVVFGGPFLLFYFYCDSYWGEGYRLIHRNKQRFGFEYRRNYFTGWCDYQRGYESVERVREEIEWHRKRMAHEKAKKQKWEVLK